MPATLKICTSDSPESPSKSLNNLYPSCSWPSSMYWARTHRGYSTTSTDTTIITTATGTVTHPPMGGTRGHHHHDGDSEDCLMSETEAAAALKIQTDDSGSHSITPLLDNDDGSFVLLAAIGLYELSFTPEYSKEKLRRRPYVASGHTDFVARSKGLRAPPVLLG